MSSHEIDPKTQASMLPLIPGQLATGAMVEIEGGFYQAGTTQPEQPDKTEPAPEVLSPKQERIAHLEAEDTALDFLGRADATDKRIINMTRGQTKLRHEGRNQAEQSRLGHTIEVSKENLLQFRRIAKKHIGLSIGIETEVVEVMKFVEVVGREKIVKDVVAKDQKQQPKLSAKYRSFLDSYDHKPKARKARRAEIALEKEKLEQELNQPAGDTADNADDVTTIKNQGTLRASGSLADVIYMSGGVVRLEDLIWPEFDPEQPLTMAEYIKEIGNRMASSSREDSTHDSELHVYGEDFEQAKPHNLLKGLYWDGNKRRRPQKLVVKVREWYTSLDKNLYPGMVPFSTDVTVSEDLYDKIVGDASWFANRIANRTERANQGLIIEKKEDLGGESALYGLTDRHLILEEEDAKLLDERDQLISVYRSLDPGLDPNQLKRVKNLEPYRLSAMTAIQTMVRLACRGLGYKTNRTQNTLNAVASNIFRSPDGDRYFRQYLAMAIAYNDAVRGKIDQSIQGLGKEIRHHAKHAINNVDREYKDD